jgi:hypothetical protein
MAKNIFLVCFFLLTFNQPVLKSQDPSIRNTIDYINTILRTNPFINDFLEITFYYSIDITPDNNLIVNMDFNGPFKSVFRSGIADLNRIMQNDSTADVANSLCWKCASNDSTKTNKCVFNEIIYSGGDKEDQYLDNICVMFSGKNEIKNKLNDAFTRLFTEVDEAKSKSTETKFSRKPE